MAVVATTSSCVRHDVVQVYAGSISHRTLGKRAVVIVCEGNREECFNEIHITVEVSDVIEISPKRVIPSRAGAPREN